MSTLDKSVRRRDDCIFCFVCLFVCFFLQRNEGFCVCTFGLHSWGLLTFFYIFTRVLAHYVSQGREGSGGDDDDDDDDDDLVIMMITIIRCSSNSVKL